MRILVMFVTITAIYSITRHVEYKSLVRIADEMGYSEIHIKKKHLKALAEVKKIKGFER